MKFKLLQYCTAVPFSNCYRAENLETGEKLYLDLHTDATFPEQPSDPASIVGEVVEVDYTHPWQPLHFGCGVRVLQSREDA